MNNFLYPNTVIFHSEPDDDEIDWADIVGDDDASQDDSWLDIFG